MGVLRVLAGLALALFAAAYYLIGMLFVMGSPGPSGYSLAFGVFGLGGICLPVVLCGLHLMLFGVDRPILARVVMVGALALSLLGAVFAMLPYILATPPHGDAVDMVLGAIVMSALFGWPMVRGLVRALLSRPD
jgi:hypothetical protein